MKTEIGQVIKELRVAKNMSQAALAEKIGVATPNISRYEKGTQGIEFEKLPLLADALDIKLSELFAKAEGQSTEVSNTDIYKVPVISWVQAGQWQEVFHDPHNLDNVEWIETSYRPRRYTYALKVVGDSMNKKFPEGCYIIVEPEEAPYDKSFIIALLPDYTKATFKQLVDDESGKYLKPLNDSYPIMPMLPGTNFCGVVKRMEMNV
ncbi:LexA family protein [Acinetobacter haemolyticus]|uniref:LexA family protein n=1 Tax=Acinetobacter haemolyticus TaxID=29430 RepID=UPI001331E011|nr:XRE family transcriptional regulator [Acinetobacter haemolyticus]QHI17209.1 helix-turn-helix domain-containing protein [Acinetobacter haemolyticus]